MSGRSVPPRSPRRTRAAVAAAVLLACAAGVGLTAAPTAAQPTLPPADGVDDRPPLPPTEPKRPPAAAKYLVPDWRNRAVFVGTRDPKTGVRSGGIEDDRPLASEKQNPGEYAAFTEVVLHARQFPAAELEQHAARDLTPDDLTFPTRAYHRLDLVRFDGKLARVRRIAPTAALKDAGLAELYQGWLVPADEPETNPVCVVFTEWHPDLPTPPPLPPGGAAGDWATPDRWVAAAGFFFKLMTYPGPGAAPATPTGAGWLKAPLLVARSVSPLPAPPADAAVPLRKELRIFQLIRDDTSLGRGNVDSLPWEELASWNRVALHARNFTAEELEAEARTDLTFADLFQESRRDYKLDLVLFRGRLVRVKELKSTRRLTEAGVPVCYEGWLVPEGDRQGHPVAVMFTELPPGLEPRPAMDVPATFAGYFFKRVRYESAEPRKDDPTKNEWKAAPLLIGRAPTLRGDAGGEPGAGASLFFPALTAGVVLLVGTALALSWWFRADDRRARAEIDAVRHRNPFSGETA